MTGETLAFIVDALAEAKADPRGDALSLRQINAILLSTLRLHPDIPVGERPLVIRKIVDKVTADANLTSDLLHSAQRAVEAEYLRQPLCDFVFATTLVPAPPVRRARRVIRGVPLDLGHRWTSDIIESRSHPESLIPAEEAIPRVGTFVTGYLRARTESDAFHRGYRALQSLLGLWNYASTFRRQTLSLGSSEPPLADVQVGKVHTIHAVGATGPLTRIWYESSYHQPTGLAVPRHSWRRITAVEARVRRALLGIKYREDMWAAFARYSEATATLDFGSGFLKMWALLEFLTGTERERNDQTVRRASFQFGRTRAVLEVLKHLQYQRNQYVHHDAADADLRLFMEQLKDIVDGLISIHIGMGSGFASVADFGQFLDLPHDEDRLKAQVALRERALRFLYGNGA